MNPDKKLRLVENGIFPIIFDKEGRKLDRIPNTGFSCSGTFQGEGKLMGIPVIFIRLSGCNLRCMWRGNDGKISICDTPYASFSADKNVSWDIEDILKTIQRNKSNIKHIVISGGEPTLQEEALLPLLKRLKTNGFHLTLETNGVYYPSRIARLIDLFSISPKLESSVPDEQKLNESSIELDEEYIQYHKNERVNIVTIQRYINHCYHSTDYFGDLPGAEIKRKNAPDFQLKFVISTPDEVNEIKKDFLARLKNLNHSDILLMPLGKNNEELKVSSRLTAQMAIENGWRYAPRLHIDVFGDTAGT